MLFVEWESSFKSVALVPRNLFPPQVTCPSPISLKELFSIFVLVKNYWKSESTK
jgi:hypothetical protein